MNNYSAYKNSDLKWIHKVPDHWGLFKAKYIFNKMARPVREEDEIVTAFRDGEVTLRKNRRVVGFTTALKEIGYQGIRSNDLVIHEMDAFAGAIGVSDSDGKSTPVYTVCTPNKPANTRYYAYLLRVMAWSGFIQSLTKGIRQRSSAFNYVTFKDLDLPYFPLPEQQAIANFLDSKTTQIDVLITKKQRKVELLEEHRHAVINQAVTKGLNPDAKMKDSGIEWLGEVPEGWDVIRLKYLANIKTGGRDTVDRIDDGEYPFFVRSQIAERINSYSFDGEAVLTAGDGAGVAKVFHYINGKFDYHQRVYKFSDFKKVKGKFIFYHSKSNLKHEVLKISAKSTVESLRLPMLQNFPVTVPPSDEQEQILIFLDKKEKEYFSAKIDLEEQINLLIEYRTTLISEAVTGKIDVREYSN